MAKTGDSRPKPLRLREVDAFSRRGDSPKSPRRRPAVGRRRKSASENRETSRTAGKRSGRAELKPSKRGQIEAGPKILRVPEWEQYGWLVHGFSTRSGGVSTAYAPGARNKLCGDLNLGFTPADPRENVERNRELFVRALIGGNGEDRSGKKSEAMRLRLLRQIHSGLVHRAAGRADKVGGSGEPPGGDCLRGDGMIATEPGALLGIQTADCIPVLVVDARQRIVAAFHAGWRGTLARIVERGVGRLRAEFGSYPGDLTAAIGPGIGRCCYAVGEEVRMEFDSQFVYANALFQEVFDLDPIKKKYPMLFLTARAPGHSNLGPSLHLDLVEANRRQLLDAGLAPEKIHCLDLCTSCNTKRFFSFRAEQGFTGRMLSAIGIRA